MSLLERSLDKVKQAIDKYHPAEIEYDLKNRASVEKALDILEQEYNHIEEIHQAVHKMLSRFQLIGGVLEGDLEQHGERRRFGKIKIESTVDFRELKKKLPQIPEQVEKREELAHYVAEAAMRLSGKSWPLWLSLLSNAKGNRAVVDPRPTPDEELLSCWRGKDTWLDEDKFAREVFERLNELLGDEEGGIRRQLKELNPPLTWGEVLYNFYRYLHENSHDETLKKEKMELDRLFYSPGRRYCFNCDQPFDVTKYHPYRSICSTCAAKKKQARWRAKRDKQPQKLQ